MQVMINNYRTFPGQDRVEVELSVELPTGSVSVMVPVKEEALQRAAGPDKVWSEEEVATVVSGFFTDLAGTVTYTGQQA